MPEEGEFIDFVKNISKEQGLTTDMWIMREIAIKIEELEERIKVLETSVKKEG